MEGPDNKNAHDDRDAEVHNQQQELDFTGGDQDDGGEAEDGADGIEDGHRLLLAQAHVNEPVVEMSPVRVHGALAPEQPAEEGENRVQQGHCQGQKRDNEGDNGVKLKQAQYGGSGQHIAQKQGARVPHEDFCRVQVIGDEADAGPGQGGQDNGHISVGNQEGNHQHGNGADGGDAAGQPVQAVNQVDAVGDGHNPDNGHRDGERPQDQVLCVAEYDGVHDHLDDNAVEHRNQRGDNLQNKLDPGV